MKDASSNVQTVHEENLEAFGPAFEMVQQRGSPASDAVFRLYTNGTRYAGQASLWNGTEKDLEERFELDTTPGNAGHPMIARMDAMRELREKAEEACQERQQEQSTEKAQAELSDGPRTGDAFAREEARRLLTARPGAVQRVAFMKRTDGSLRTMRFRYDPDARTPIPNAASRGLLPVYDLDKRAARFVNLDGVCAVLPATGEAFRPAV